MLEQIIELISKNMGVAPEQVTPQAQFQEDLKLNSLELADLVVLCEEKTGIEIGEDDIHTLLTVGDLVAYIEKKRGA